MQPHHRNQLSHKNFEERKWNNFLQKQSETENYFEIKMRQRAKYFMVFTNLHIKAKNQKYICMRIYTLGWPLELKVRFFPGGTTRQFWILTKKGIDKASVQLVGVKTCSRPIKFRPNPKIEVSWHNFKSIAFIEKLCKRKIFSAKF